MKIYAGRLNDIFSEAMDTHGTWQVAGFEPTIAATNHSRHQNWYPAFPFQPSTTGAVEGFFMSALSLSIDTLIIFNLIKQGAILTQQKCPEPA